MVKKRLDSFKYAFKGLFDLFKTQPNAIIHLIITLLAIGAGIFFSISLLEWGLVFMAIVMVFSAEAFNTAIEYLTDRVSPEYHPLAGKAKDAAAAGVLIAAIGSVTIGLIVFLPKVWNWIY